MWACDARASRRMAHPGVFRPLARMGPRDCSRNDADPPDRVGMGTANPPKHSRTDVNPPVCVVTGMVDPPKHLRDDANLPVFGVAIRTAG